MRLLIDGRTVQDRFPGIGRYVFNLVDALAGVHQGEIVLLVNPALPNSRYDLSALARHANVRLHPTDIPTFHLREQIELPRLIRSLRPDVVHLPYNVRPYRQSLPNVLTLFDVIPRRFPADYSLRARWTIELVQRLALRSATRFVAISQAAAADFMTLYGVSAAAITVTPLAADPLFAPQPAAVVAALRQRLPLPDRYLLYLGSNKPHKNLPRLIRAFAAVTPQSPGTDLVIAGAWDPRSPEARQLVVELGLEDAVRFLPNVLNADLPALYAGATAFVFPSLYEGFGLPVLEAMACGAPVACSNTSSLPEVAGEAAVLFDPVDVNEMATAINRLLDDEGLRERLRERGRLQAARFTWKRTAELTLIAYRQA